tara:strand:+ start:383 stop:619 length:237 start_codon:yes stop_codon:yes gene_type:complete
MVSKILIFFIKVYRLLVSPILGQNCRFWPTCSDYSIQALQEYGVLKGTKFILKRIVRCNPWGGSGIDVLPKRDAKDKN